MLEDVVGLARSFRKELVGSLIGMCGAHAWRWVATATSWVAPVETQIHTHCWPSVQRPPGKKGHSFEDSTGREWEIPTGS